MALIGIIPTRVGTSRRNSVAFRFVWDHPHACGDKKSIDKIAGGTIGSSPRVWGQVGLDIWYQFDSRIIPTRVGTSFKKSDDLKNGEGSSPRVWGQVSLTSSGISPAGIIPTRVGTSTQIDYISMTELGSSPRVWGQVYEAQDNAMNYRIIPTRVGTSYYFVRIRTRF